MNTIIHFESDKTCTFTKDYENVFGTRYMTRPLLQLQKNLCDNIEKLRYRSHKEISRQMTRLK